MARVVGLSASTWSAVRTIAGSPIPADSVTLSDANFPPDPDPVNGGAIQCRGIASIFLGSELTGGTSITIELLVRDPDAADQRRWRRLVPASAGTEVTYILDGSLSSYEVQVDGALVYPRIVSVVGNNTAAVILARPGSMQTKRPVQ